MGLNVSHGSDRYGEERRSYGTVANLATHLANVLPGRDWAQLAPYFSGRAELPLDISPGTARTLAAILERAAGHRRMPREWAAEARLFAQAADRAAAAGQFWSWS